MSAAFDREVEAVPGHVLRIAPQNDVCSSASHVGSNSDGALPTTLPYDLRLTLHILWLGVQQLIIQICIAVTPQRQDRIRHDCVCAGSQQTVLQYSCLNSKLHFPEGGLSTKISAP